MIKLRVQNISDTYLLPRFFPSMLPNGKRAWGNILKATLADNLVAAPLMYCEFSFYLLKLLRFALIFGIPDPMFYVFKDCVVDGSHDVGGALKHMCNELPAQLATCWSFWIPTTAVSQGFVPVHMRIPFLSAATIAWVGLLSATTSSLDAAKHE